MNEPKDELEVEITGSAAGTRSAATPVVFVTDQALRDMRAHAAEDTSNERAGILVGSAAASSEGTLVSIEAMIPALHTEAHRGSVTFTHETWTQINACKDRDYPDLRIVGWYHTHPGFGLFLSDYDKFIHTNFFSLPWQVALVVDPRAEESGVFVWRDGQLAGPLDPRLVAQTGAEMPMPRMPQMAAAATPIRRGPSRVWQWCVSALLVVVLGLQGLQLYSSRSKPPEPASVVASAPTPGQTASPELAGEVKALKEQVASLQTEVARGKAAPAGEAERKYTVQRGDSLWRIAQHVYGDGNLWGAIALANGLKGEDLEPGMVLKIPKPQVPRGEAPDAGGGTGQE